MARDKGYIYIESCTGMRITLPRNLSIFVNVSLVLETSTSVRLKPAIPTTVFDP